MTLSDWPSTVIKRRNWLFSDTVAGAHASANLYSLLQTCAVNGVDGFGCSPDNAACEGFLGRLKTELFYPSSMAKRRLRTKPGQRA